MFRIISIAIVALILGGCTTLSIGVPAPGYECYEGKYKKPTDLSKIEEGVLRANVDKLLGKPHTIRDVGNLTPRSYKTLTIYSYIGEGWPRPYGPNTHRVTKRDSFLVEYSYPCPPADEQNLDLPLLVAYDENDRVIKKWDIIGELFRLEWNRKDYKARAYWFRDSPKTTIEYFALTPTRHLQNYWLCLNAYNRHAWALIEMGRRYSEGDQVSRQDKVLGYMWYSLAAKSDPAQANKQKELQRFLTPAQISKADQLAKKLPSGWLADSPCDALPGG